MINHHKKIECWRSYSKLGLHVVFLVDAVIPSISAVRTTTTQASLLKSKKQEEAMYGGWSLVFSFAFLLVCDCLSVTHRSREVTDCTYLWYRYLLYVVQVVSIWNNEKWLLVVPADIILPVFLAPAIRQAERAKFPASRPRHHFLHNKHRTINQCTQTCFISLVARCFGGWPKESLDEFSLYIAPRKRKRTGED